MESINISVVITVLNEEKSIGVLLDTLINQTVLPNEVIIVDAGSSDNTRSIVSQKQTHSDFPIAVFHCPGMNRSQGRNFGIEKAQNELVVVTDAGCELDPHWIEYIQQGFAEHCSSVAGYYLPIIRLPIQRLFAAYVSVLPEQFNEQTFLPSSRSLGFTKSIWKQIGGYPESLTTCEDLVFAERLKKAGKMYVARNALVYWYQAESITEFYRQIVGYARGDVQAMYMPHVWKIVSVWLRYVLFLAMPPLFFLYFLYPFAKHRKELTHDQSIFALPMVQIVCDWGVMVGSLQALLRKIWKV
jgi:glycosyltransferase involved in cell wall biosynthesis